MTVRMGPWSLRIAPRALAVTALLLLIACAVALAAISTGEFTVPAPDILTADLDQVALVRDEVPPTVVHGHATASSPARTHPVTFASRAGAVTGESSTAVVLPAGEIASLTSNEAGASTHASLSSAP